MLQNIRKRGFTLTTRNVRDRLTMVLLSMKKNCIHRKLSITCDIFLIIKTHACTTQDFQWKPKGQINILWKTYINWKTLVLKPEKQFKWTIEYIKESAAVG